jgi:CubicO group peptidase (beta-lactamase class C family)
MIRVEYIRRPGSRVAVEPRQGAQTRRSPPNAAVPAREITIRDLLTHVSGLGSGPMASASIGAAEIARKPTDRLSDYVPRLGRSVLEFQPGSRWTYSPAAAFDTLGHIVEITSGQPLDAFLRLRVFEPLGMKDVSFSPSAAIEPRLVTAYLLDPGGQARKDSNPNRMQSKVYFSGGGGLVATAEARSSRRCSSTGAS